MRKIIINSDFKARKYQESTFANSLNKNSLIVFPTGLGKTIIAVMQTIYYFNQTNKKILFLAPTKPLVEQQEKSFKNFFQNKDNFNFQVLTGLTPPKKRKELYQKNDFIFSTPQLIENDIVNDIINPNDFCLIIIDEAHRSTGNYSYCFIAEQFYKKNIKILALTASPGTDKETIKQILNNLKIQHLEIKKNTDNDVIPYIKETKIEKIEIELSQEFKEIQTLLNNCLNKKIKKLHQLGFLQNKYSNQITKKDLLELQSYLRVNISQERNEKNNNIFKAISISAGIMKLQYGQELFETQQVNSAYDYFYNFFRNNGDKSKAAQELTLDIDFKTAFDKISQLNKNKIKHPKLNKLKDIVNNQILKNKELKIIIFNQYRNSAEEIVKELSKIKEIKPALFIGQAKKEDIKLSQKEQKQILEDFRNNKYNILISTSVGEEGLDIPKVDLVIFYEPITSAIRAIQRIGRTGRFEKGKCIILITKDTRDVITSYISNAKEKKMYKILEELKEEFNSNKQSGLNKYINKKYEKEEQKIKIENNEQKKLIYIDNRENNDLIKELFNFEDIKIETKKLETGDIVINDYIAIERKSKKDFVNSILNKRLFEQLINLNKNYKRPILIIEGEENIFSLKNIHPNIIRTTIGLIATELRTPIIYTNNIKETALMIKAITKRSYKEKNNISLVTNKSSINKKEEIEKIVSNIPQINMNNSKKLLNHFNSIKSLANAKIEEIQKIQGIGIKRAQIIYDTFNYKYK